MRALGALILMFLPVVAGADTVLAARNIRAQTVIGPHDIALHGSNVPGAYSTVDEVLGLEARVILYAGRPIRPGDLGPPALVERNQIVQLIYNQAGLSISAEGRALDRGGVGERIRVMNMSSRSSLFGEVQPNGTIKVTY